MTSSTARPLAVILHPPLRRSTSPCDQMLRPGALAASRLVRSAQSQPLVARIAMSRLRSSITAKPSGYAAKIFKTVTWKFTPAPARSAPHRGRTREGVPPDLPEALGRDLAPGSSFQDLRCHMRTRPDLAVRKTLAYFVEDRAQKRGGCRIEHEVPPRRESSILAEFSRF